MGEIDKVLKLYRLMAERCEKSGHAPRQARVYREMITFMQGCPTVDEATDKIRNSKYYLAPSAALLQDKLAAFERASRENDMPDVAAVYQKKIEEIDADVAEMYETGYEVTARNLKIPYIQTYEAFSAIYDCYLTLSCCIATDKTVIENTMKELKEHLAKLTKPSSDFSELAARPAFRALIPATDAGYARFVRAVPQLAQKGPDFEAEKQEIQKEFKQALKLLKSEQAAVKGAGKTNRAKVKRSQVLVVAPDTKSGSYSYADEEVTSFE